MIVYELSCEKHLVYVDFGFCYTAREETPNTHPKIHLSKT